MFPSYYAKDRFPEFPAEHSKLPFDSVVIAYPITVMTLKTLSLAAPDVP